MAGPGRRRGVLVVLLSLAALLSASMLAPAFGAPDAVSAASLATKVARALKLSKAANRNAALALARSGQPGPAGPAGAQGPAGPAGAAGPTGPAGNKGDTGAKGEACLSSDPACIGPVGNQGERGEPGKQGERGDACLPDLKGCQGPQGLDGAKGEPGDPAAASAHTYTRQMPANTSPGVLLYLFNSPLADLSVQCKIDGVTVHPRYRVWFMDKRAVVVESNPSPLTEQHLFGIISGTLMSSPTQADGTPETVAHGLTFAVTGSVNADGQSCTFHAYTVES